jgi:hypothetical protein
MSKVVKSKKTTSKLTTMSNPTALSIMNVHFVLVSYSMVKSINSIF